MDLVTELTIAVLAVFVGFEVISKVPATLHTPLMSQTNAIHGIVVLGGLIVVGYSTSTLSDIIGFIAIVFGTINVVGVAGDNQAAEHHDPVDRVGLGHQRRVQRRRDLRDHLEAHERGEDEDRQLGNQIHLSLPRRPTWRARS